MFPRPTLHRIVWLAVATWVGFLAAAPPVIEHIGPRSTAEDTPLAVTFDVGRKDKKNTVFTVTATSSQPSIVPNANLVVTPRTGPAGTRTLTITPLLDRNTAASGPITITVVVDDGEEESGRTSFPLTITPVDDPPTVTALADQVTTSGTPIGPLVLTLADVDTDPATLRVSATGTTNPGLMPLDRVVIEPATATTRRITLSPVSGLSGSATITLTVSDGTNAVTTALRLTVVAPAPPPSGPTVTILNVPTGGFTTDEDVPLAGPSAISLSLADPDTPVIALQLRATSSNQALVPDANLAITGTGATRQLSIVPLQDASGTTTITVTVSDGGTTPGTQQVPVTVRAVNDAPTLSTVAPAAVQKNGSVTVAFTVADVDDPPSALTLSASSSNPAVVNASADTSLVFGGAGRDRTLTITPALNAVGQTTIAVTATDPGRASATAGFVLTVADVPCAYGLVPDRVAVGAAGGTRFLTVRASAGCGWGLEPSAPATWLTLDAPASGFGDGAVSLTAQPNPGPDMRDVTLVLQHHDDAGRPTGAVRTIVVAQDGTASGDADGDGLPSAWEARFGLDPTVPDGADGPQGDPDGDGETNLEELHHCDDPAIGCTHPRGFAANTRYLAEGANTALFDTRLALLNPGTADAHVLLRFLRTDGVSVTHSVLVPAQTRRTLDTASVPGLSSAEFSTVVESDGLVIVDRTMSWDRTGYGSHAETALASPSSTWYLAEGATHSGFDLFYLLQNPTGAVVRARIRYLLPAGPPLAKTYALPPRSRTNVWVNHETFPGLGEALASTDVSAVVETANGEGIVVERAMYLSAAGRQFAAGHESAGVPRPATEWFLAEGATGAFFDLFVLIANPNDADAAVRVRYLLESGVTLERSYTIAANSRFNIWVDLEDPLLANAALSTVVTVTNGVPIVVERAMWWPDGAWREAHDAAGATETGTMWAVAEGEVGGPRSAETYLLVANTSPWPGRVKVRLMLEDGSSRERTFDVLPNSRFSVPVAAYFSDVRDARFGAVIESEGSTPARLVVERAMYTSPNGVWWEAGTDALAARLR